MGYILHMSDFHFGKNPEKEKERIDLLADWIKDQSIDIKYVVFTGDAIDGPSITVESLLFFVRQNIDDFTRLIPNLCDQDGLIDGKKQEELTRDESCAALIKAVRKNTDLFSEHIKSLSEEKVAAYNQVLKDHTNRQMDDAITIIRNFLTHIAVPYDRFIACCGNHDRIRYLTSEKTSFTCEKYHIEEDEYSADYEPYGRLCQAINNQLSYNTSTYSHEDVTFVIANSNWRTPTHKESNNMCIHCGAVVERLRALTSKADFKRNSNIFIAHKPFDDICENAKFPYGAGQEVTAREFIEQNTAMFLHGDKHSYAVKNKNWLKEFMCGMPLAYDGVRYNLIDYDSQKGVQTSRFILFSNEKWTQIPIMDFVDETFKISESYLKRYAFTLLSPGAKQPINGHGAIQLIQSAIDSGRVHQIEQLFASCVKLYSDKRRPLEKNALLERFITTVDNSDRWLAMGVKGEPGRGKSTFLTVEYLYLLWRFYSGNCKYIPFYFDADSLTEKIEAEVVLDGTAPKIEAIIERYAHYFTDFLDKAIRLGEKYDIPICVFVDGLDSQNMLTDTGKALEASLYDYLESSFRGHRHKCIMGLNTHSNHLFENSFAQLKQFQFALFFNPVYIVPYKREERHTDFLSAYWKLTNKTNTDNFSIVLKKLRRIAIDLDFLNKYDLLLSENIPEEDSWSTMRRQVSQMDRVVSSLFKVKDNSLNLAAYLMMIKGDSYQAICEGSLKNFIFSDFMKLRNNPEITEFLVARHYLDELKKFTNSDDAIPQDSILYCFITRDLGVKIRLQMEESGYIFKGLQRFVERHRAELHGHLSSTIVYLAGHSKKHGNAELVESVQSSDTAADNFFKFCARRSRDLALIVCEENRTELANNFIHEMINDEAYRFFNRSYQLRYYQDITDLRDYNGAAWRIEKSRGIGFDFSNCFLTLVSKLDYSFETNTPYPMMEIDLYTLCDLIFSRLQMFGSKKALFYSSENNQKGDSLAVAILQRVVLLLDRYETSYMQKRAMDALVQTYFSFMKAQFAEVRQELEKRPGENISSPFVPLSKDIKDVIHLLNQPRVGWNITKSGTVRDADRPKYAQQGILGMPLANCGNVESIRETIGQHILESMFIAQLYLPASLEVEGYCKATVLSMLLMSEIGKLQLKKDYTPLYSEARDYLLQEKDCMNQFLLRGAIDGYANFTELFGFLTVVGSSQDSPANINMRICQEIKQIQMEYKYYSLRNILNFEQGRTEEFMKDFVKPDTPICKEIHKKLIDDNPDFIEFFSAK